MFFNAFIQDRGLPYRPCDLFDEVSKDWSIALCSFDISQLYATINETLKKESKLPELVLHHVRELASQLHSNVSFT